MLRAKTVHPDELDLRLIELQKDNCIIEQVIPLMSKLVVFPPPMDAKDPSDDSTHIDSVFVILYEDYT